MVRSNIGFARLLLLALFLSIFSIRGAHASASSPSRVIGSLDLVVPEKGGFRMQGWACKIGEAKSLDVHFYAGGPYGVGTGFGAYKANNAVSTAEKTAILKKCGVRNFDKFSFDVLVPSDDVKYFYNKDVYVHGISARGGTNGLLTNSGTFKILDRNIGGNRDPRVFKPMPEIKVGVIYEPWHCNFGDKDERFDIRLCPTCRDGWSVTAVPGTRGITKNYDMTKALGSFQAAKKRNDDVDADSFFGPIFKYHWFDEPQLGYYCLSERDDVLIKHAQQLTEAHIDFVVIDMSNADYQSYEAFHTIGNNEIWDPLNNPETGYIKPVKNLMRVWSELEKAGVQVPKIVPWIALKNSPKSDSKTKEGKNCPSQETYLQWWWDKLMNPQFGEYRDLAFMYEGKPLWLALTSSFFDGSNLDRCSDSAIEPAFESFKVRSDSEAIALFSNQYTVRRMWGMLPGHNPPRGKRKFEWSFVESCRTKGFKQSQAEEKCDQWVMDTKEHVSVTSAYQQPGALMTDSDAVPKFNGKTFLRQMDTVYEVRPKIMTVWAWNQWGTVRFPCNDPEKCLGPCAKSASFAHCDKNLQKNGLPVFMDGWVGEYNNDFEPGKNSGDTYYQLLKAEIKALKGLK